MNRPSSDSWDGVWKDPLDFLFRGVDDVSQTDLSEVSFMGSGTAPVRPRPKSYQTPTTSENYSRRKPLSGTSLGPSGVGPEVVDKVTVPTESVVSASIMKRVGQRR